MNQKAGYVTIIGLPNAGKSTLMNALLGENISIITNKPQTTRKRVLGILTQDSYQVVFLDTPGILKPNYLMQERMLDYIHLSIRDADVLVFLIDADKDPDGEKLLTSEVADGAIKYRKSQKIALINKVDLSNESKVKALISRLEETKHFDDVIPISAQLGFNLDKALAAMVEYIPEHPKFYPEDQVSDENERFFVSEIIREKIFEQYSEEIPYSSEVMIEDFKEREDRKDYIRASIVVEKESQKPIIIGKKGDAVKKLGQAARESIEKFLQRPVYLELNVKVRDNWRSKPAMLRSFGYDIDKE